MRQAMYTHHNTESCSHNHCCCRRAVKYCIFSVCPRSLSYTQCTMRAPCYIVICGLSGSAECFYIISKNSTIFRKNL